MKFCAYGTEDHIAIAPYFAKFESVLRFRETAINYDLIIILDSSVDEINSLKTAMEFYRSVKSTQFIFLYENPELSINESLFDRNYCLNFEALDNGTVNSIILNAVSDSVLQLSKSAESTQAAKFAIPKKLPADPSKLSELLHSMTARLSMSELRNRQSLKLLIDQERRNELIYNQLSASKLRESKMQKQLEQLALANQQLRLTQDMFIRATHAEQTGAPAEVNLTNVNTNKMLIINIHEVDEMLYTRTFLKLLKKKIESRLGLPTKVVVLEEVPRKISYYDDYLRIYSQYNNNVFSNEFIVKLGYSQDFMFDILHDTSAPRILILYNTIPSLTFSAEYSINYFATRGAPNRQPITSDFESHTITNAPGYDLSWETDWNYADYQNIDLAPMHLIESDVFNYILEDLEFAVKTKNSDILNKEWEEHATIK